MRSNSSGVRPCCLTSSGVTAGSAVGIWLVIDRCKVTNPQDRSITQMRIFIKSSHPGSVRHVFELRTLGVNMNMREASMVKKAIIALACVLMAAPAFAQTITTRTRYHRTTTPLTTVEGVTVTAPIISAQEATAASYQPAGTSGSFARTVRIRSGLICSGPGSCMISMADPYAARSNQVHGWLYSTPATATRVLLITSWCWIDGSVCPSNTCGLQPSKGKVDRHNLRTPVKVAEHDAREKPSK